MIRKLFLIPFMIAHTLFTLSPEMTKKIGEQIWQNEASGREDLLVFWNEKESFPSFGIGHNIWFPEGREFQYTQSFPLLCDYLKDHGVSLPSWLEESLPSGAPWQNREDFYSDHARTKELQQLFVTTVDLQTQFMIDRLEQKLIDIKKSAPEEDREKVEQNINLMMSSAQGTYALVDYLNFKGDGLNPKEESNGKRWGLLSVLIDMPNNLTQDNVTKAFTIAAAKKLLMLIEHSAPDYRRITFLAGWMKRLGTYSNSKLFS